MHFQGGLVKKIALRGAAFVTVSAALMAMGAQVPANASSVTFLPTCQAIHNRQRQAPDGDYLLLNNGNLLTVYCGGMSTTPRSYIDLNKTGANVNFSQYTAGGASPGTNVRTNFTKVGIDPATLQADIGDLAFASSTGSLLHSGSTTVTSMAYGVAMSCVAPNNAAGVANINLTGTPFRVTSTFATGGAAPAGTAAVSLGKQVVNLTGGGFCGWMMSAPALFNPFNPSPGMYHLQLACTSATVVNQQICFSLPRRAAITQQGRQWNGHPAVTVRLHGRTVAVVGSNGRVLS
jgi:GON domain